MKLGNVIKSFAVVAAILCTSHVNAQDVELATNLSFEDPIGMEGELTPDQWNPFMGDGATGAGTGTDFPLDGATHGALTIAGTNDSFAGFQYQIDGVTPGLAYTFSFSARSAGPDLGGVDGELRIEFLDADGGFVGGQFDNNQPVAATDTYASFSQTQVIPFGATSLRAVVSIQSFGAGLDASNDGTLFIDSASIMGPPLGTPGPTPPPTPTPGPVMELGVNNSFEDPIGASGDQAPGTWNPFDNDGNTLGTTDTTAPLTGATHGVASISGDENSFAGFVQQVDNIIPGEPYTFSLNARSDGVDLEGIDAEFRLEFIDANGGFVEDQFTNNAPLVVTDTYAPFTQTHIAPPGSVSLRAVIAVQSFGGGADGSNSNSGGLFIDDTSIMGSLPAMAIKGDADMDGDVDFLDIPAFIAILQAGNFVAEADCDCDLDVDFADIPPFIAILQNQ